MNVLLLRSCAHRVIGEISPLEPALHRLAKRLGKCPHRFSRAALNYISLVNSFEGLSSLFIFGSTTCVVRIRPCGLSFLMARQCDERCTALTGRLLNGPLFLLVLRHHKMSWTYRYLCDLSETLAHFVGEINQATPYSRQGLSNRPPGPIFSFSNLEPRPQVGVGARSPVLCYPVKFQIPRLDI